MSSTLGNNINRVGFDLHIVLIQLQRVEGAKRHRSPSEVNLRTSQPPRTEKTQCLLTSTVSSPRTPRVQYPLVAQLALCSVALPLALPTTVCYRLCALTFVHSTLCCRLRALDHTHRSSTCSRTVLSLAVPFRSVYAQG